jgi:hypothetical protein
MNRAEFLDALRKGRAEWEALISGIDRARMEIPGVEGDWSIKDIIAHVTWYEREMIEVARDRVLKGSPHWALPATEERNAAIHADTRALSLDDVLLQSTRVYRELYQALQTLGDEDLAQASRFRDMPAEWVPRELIASNTCEHYPQHIPHIRAWLDGQGD